MPEIFQYDFMQRAFITGILIAIIAPCIGVVMVLKRFSLIGEALSHNSLAGVTAGLIAGINPILGAMVFSIAACLSIEKIRQVFPRYSELAIAIITSIGIGLAGIFSGFTKNGATFNSFLFGSIVAISDFEFWMVGTLSLVVIFLMYLLYKELFYIIFDEESARLAGIPVGIINLVFMLVTAIVISISSRTVGTLVISSLMILPVATSLQLARSYKETILYSVVFAVLSTIIAIFVSYYGNLKPGGTIVLINVFFLLAVLGYKNFCLKRWTRKVENFAE